MSHEGYGYQVYEITHTNPRGLDGAYFVQKEHWLDPRGQLRLLCPALALNVDSNEFVYIWKSEVPDEIAVPG